MFGQNKTMTGRRIRWLAVTVVAAVVGLGLTASISTPASANMASAYTGATTTVAWKLAPSIHDLATLRANPGAQQTYFGTGAPACTEDSRSFQVDVYKYDAKHKPLVDALVAGGILYIAPKTPNDSAVFVSAQIVTPPRCKPDQPKPEVTNDKETDKSCADGVRERTKTTTVDWVWNEAKWDWVKGEPVVTYSKVTPTDGRRIYHRYHVWHGLDRKVVVGTTIDGYGVCRVSVWDWGDPVRIAPISPRSCNAVVDTDRYTVGDGVTVRYALGLNTECDSYRPGPHHHPSD